MFKNFLEKSTIFLLIDWNKIVIVYRRTQFRCPRKIKAFCSKRNLKKAGPFIFKPFINPYLWVSIKHPLLSLSRYDLYPMGVARSDPKQQRGFPALTKH